VRGKCHIYAIVKVRVPVEEFCLHGDVTSAYYVLHVEFLFGLFFDPLEAICSSETSVEFQRTTLCCIFRNWNSP
jgi:hypothetical protein